MEVQSNLASYLFVVAVAAVTTAGCAQAFDFETIPGGLVVSDQFAETVGVTYSL